MFERLKKNWKIVVCVAFLAALLLSMGVVGQRDGNWYWGWTEDGEYWEDYVEHHRWISVNVAAASTIVFVFLLLLVRNNVRDLLTVLAMFFAVLLDVHIQYSNYLVAVVIYIIFQSFCTARLYFNLVRKRIILDLILRSAAVVIAEAVAWILFGSNFSVLYFASVFYFVNLVMNCITAGLQIKINPIFFAGIAMFVISDIFIGLNQLDVIYINQLIEITYVLALALIAVSSILKPAQGESGSVLKSASTCEA